MDRYQKYVIEGYWQFLTQELNANMASSQAISFKTWKPTKGWRLAHVVANNRLGKVQDRQILVPMVGDGIETIEPDWEDPTLFIKFLQIDPTPKNFVKFAENWGPIEVFSYSASRAKISEIEDDLIRTEYQGLDHEYLYTQDLLIWEHAHDDLMQLYQFALAIDDKDVVKTCLFMEGPTDCESWDWDKEAAWEKAWDAWWRRLNHHFTDFATVTLRFVKHRDGQMYERIEPNNLSALMMYQMARAIANNSQWSNCEVCGSIMVVGSDKRQQKKRFCSDACKMKNYRKNLKREKPEETP